ncbi:hypothetical protein [Falsiroseomonas sp.]|uniref:hypothetical protein n=1 Tax=Falsiroseomonas sp. TaxID=2870721 RepID=UPI0035693AA6
MGSTAKGILAGALALALPILLQVALEPMLGDGFLLALLFLAALVPGFGVALVWSGGAPWRLAAGALLMMAVPFASLGMLDARVLGPVPTTTLEAALGNGLAAGFRLADAAPDAALQRIVNASSTHRPTDQRNRRGPPVTERGTFLVAPVLGSGWSQADPVRLVVVQDLDEAPARPWAPSGGVLKLLPDRLRQAAVRQALAEAGLAMAPDILIARWVANPDWARVEAALPLLWLYSGALAVWNVLARGTEQRGGR